MFCHEHSPLADRLRSGRRDSDRSVAFLGRSMIRNIETAQRNRLSRHRRRPGDLAATRRRGCRRARSVCWSPEVRASRCRRLRECLSISTAMPACSRTTRSCFLRGRFPGNERAISRMMNHLFKKGAHVIDSGTARIHVSGHGREGDLKIMYDAVRPKFLIPIHGETRQLYRHAEAARSWGMSREIALSWPRAAMSSK